MNNFQIPPERSWRDQSSLMMHGIDVYIMNAEQNNLSVTDEDLKNVWMSVGLRIIGMGVLDSEGCFAAKGSDRDRIFRPMIVECDVTR